MCACVHARARVYGLYVHSKRLERAVAESALPNSLEKTPLRFEKPQRESPNETHSMYFEAASQGCGILCTYKCMVIYIPLFLLLPPPPPPSPPPPPPHKCMNILLLLLRLEMMLRRMSDNLTESTA